MDSRSAVEHRLEPVVDLPEPFDEFYRREYRAMVDLAFALTGDRQVGEDLAQDALISAHKPGTTLPLRQTRVWCDSRLPSERATA
jgi:DNA-directed RNA polymerase specialized sigma24 family protein